jgi:hypothetical protein
VLLDNSSVGTRHVSLTKNNVVFLLITLLLIVLLVDLSSAQMVPVLISVSTVLHKCSVLKTLKLDVQMVIVVLQ